MDFIGDNYSKKFDSGRLINANNNIFVLSAVPLSNEYKTLREQNGSFYQVPVGKILKIIGIYIRAGSTAANLVATSLGTGTNTTTSVAPAGDVTCYSAYLQSGVVTASTENRFDCNVSVAASLYPYIQVSTQAGLISFANVYCYLEDV